MESRALDNFPANTDEAGKSNLYPTIRIDDGLDTLMNTYNSIVKDKGGNFPFSIQEDCIALDPIRELLVT